jgi:hypothetical protein
MSIITDFDMTEKTSKSSKKVALKSKKGDKKEEDDDEDEDEDDEEGEEEELYLRPCPLISTAAVHVGRYFLIIGGFNNRYKERAEVWVRFFFCNSHVRYFIFSVTYLCIFSLTSMSIKCN